MEMKWNGKESCVAVTIYIVLITLFFYFERNPHSYLPTDEKFDNCSGYGNPCFSYCEEDSMSYNDNYLMKNFPFDSSNFDDDRNFTVIRHSIKCTSMEKRIIIDDTDKFKLYFVRNLFKSNSESSIIIMFLLGR